MTVFVVETPLMTDLRGISMKPCRRHGMEGRFVTKSGKTGCRLCNRERWHSRKLNPKPKAEAEVTWENALGADGPKLVEWLESVRDLVDLGKRLPSVARRLHDWKTGSTASFFTVDKVLGALDIHPSEPPDSVWVASAISAPNSRPKRDKRARRVDPEPRFCEICGGVIPYTHPNGQLLSPSKYNAKRFCSRACQHEDLRG